MSFSKYEKKNKFWRVRCDCGTEKWIVQGSLIYKKSLSCGCLRGELAKQKFTGVAKTTNPKTHITEIYLQYRADARRRNLEFNLTRDQCEKYLVDKCYYCGTLPTRIRSKRRIVHSIKVNGIDRVDSSKGYHIDNCVTACIFCNSAKRDRTLEEFQFWIQQLTEFTLKNKNGQ